MNRPAPWRSGSGGDQGSGASPAGRPPREGGGAESLRRSQRRMVGCRRQRCRSPCRRGPRGTPDHSALQQAAETLTGLRTRLAEEEAEELEARHSQQLRSAEQSALTAAQAQQSAEELTANVDQLTKSRQELAERRQDEVALDAAAESARERVTDADSIVQLMARRDRAAEQQERRQAEAERAHEQYRAQDDDYQRAVSAYRGGMAAQLAYLLEPGEPCMVCGSVEHPAPHAADEEEGATLEQVDEAQQRMTAAHQKAVAAAAAHRTAQQQYDELLEELGGEAEDSDAHTSAQEAAQRLESAHQELSRAQEARREQQHIARELERSAEELHAAQRYHVPGA
ncbi:hypothetical protein [Nesterenkonia pannonica]|uniref:hypothetical protein n=1 Tax=Nesterenkonia pannonica TaxID=1548602 RepID=UPI002164D67F|nr:hypothetical protein [Nesterenkonia pannonica]